MHHDGFAGNLRHRHGDGWKRVLAWLEKFVENSGATSK